MNGKDITIYFKINSYVFKAKTLHVFRQFPIHHLDKLNTFL